MEPGILFLPWKDGTEGRESRGTVLFKKHKFNLPIGNSRRGSLCNFKSIFQFFYGVRVPRVSAQSMASLQLKISINIKQPIQVCVWACFQKCFHKLVLRIRDLALFHLSWIRDKFLRIRDELSTVHYYEDFRNHKEQEKRSRWFLCFIPLLM
jgi:hypothetical protein